MKALLENLGILIPTRNRAEILSTTLRELGRAGLGKVPLWVYDDCSTESAAIQSVVREWPNGQVIRGKTRVGQAEGRNILMRSCDKQFGLLLDDDSFPISSMGLQRHLQENREPKRAIITFQYLDVPTQRLSTPNEVGEGLARTFQGGGSLFHIPSVLKVGGFRSFFIYGYEEPELAMRVRLNGYEIWYDPSIVVRHNHFETPNENRDYGEYDYLYARNSILMSSLNMPLWFGLPHGLARSVRRSFFRRRNLWPKLRGTISGISLSLSLWANRTPCSVNQALEWCRFSKTCPR